METTITGLISWAEYKRQNNIGAVQPMQGKGRAFVPTPVGTIFVGKGVDLKQPLFVFKGAHEAMWLVNTKAQAVGDTI